MLTFTSSLPILNLLLLRYHKHFYKDSSECYRELGYLSKMANRRDFLNAVNLRITHPF